MGACTPLLRSTGRLQRKAGRPKILISAGRARGDWLPLARGVLTQGGAIGWEGDGVAVDDWAWQPEGKKNSFAWSCVPFVIVMAAGRASSETNLLKANVEDQLQRLLTQLQDVEAMKDDLDEDEYNELKQETIQQLKEFQGTLRKMMEGDVTLVDKLGSMQLAIQAAVSSAFKTPEVIKMFAQKQPGQLRDRLVELQMNVKLGKMTRESVTQQAVEILAALDKLGEDLSPAERSFLAQHNTESLSQFRSATVGVGTSAQAGLVAMAGSQISKASR
ncbi:MAG: hypothetical protein Q8P67_18820 [archaeon]|nr:hypothetical protein [archaeon]